MKVKCRANSGKALTPKYLALGDTPQTVFHVAIEKEYKVFAVAVYRGVVLLLLSDEDELPNWYPVDLFSMSHGRIPEEWFSAMYPGNDDGLQFLMGYPRIVSDESHYDALLERDPSAIEAFRLEKRKSEASEDDMV